MELLTVAVVHWLHVGLAIYWTGTIFFTRLVLFPALRRIPEHERPVRQAIVEGPSRRLTFVASTGTVGLGAIRGAMSGALGDLTSPYGLTYLASLIIGLGMLSFLWLGFPRGEPWPKVYVAAFPVMFTLMVLMRFGL